MSLRDELARLDPNSLTQGRWISPSGRVCPLATLGIRHGVVTRTALRQADSGGNDSPVVVPLMLEFDLNSSEVYEIVEVFDNGKSRKEGLKDLVDFLAWND